MENQEDESSNFKIDLISSLFGQQIAHGILKDDQNPTKEDANSSCTHPIFMENICTRCGKQINSGEIRTIPFSYIYPNLSLGLLEVNRIRDQNLRSLLTRKKLHLVVDLDHTLLHQRPSYKLTPEDKKFLGSRKRGIHRNVVEDDSLIKVPCGWVKLRPYVRNFLEEVSTMFDMTIYTLGGRSGSWTVAKILDPAGKYFDNWRVISRDDCVTLDKHKKWLDLVLQHDKVVVVLDDNEAVWEDYKANYVRVIPYNFFSYFSPNDKEHDASPPRSSWSQLNGDESEEDGVLAAVLRKLRMIHSGFYDDDNDVVADRDVRDVIRRVQMCQKSGKKQKRHKKKIGRS
ncbi:RNA polymerase II C-terminal domain phosphatase-like 4 [Silene latifolia]|uniref:RNA polymerase II C-terminal domain phosphatase-like 4 n=1 Tax=Silene latifolia TaxID=37657 RepID=UPI003D76CFDA